LYGKIKHSSGWLQIDIGSLCRHTLKGLTLKPVKLVGNMLSIAMKQSTTPFGDRTESDRHAPEEFVGPLPLLGREIDTVEPSKNAKDPVDLSTDHHGGTDQIPQPESAPLYHPARKNVKMGFDRPA